MKIEKLDTNNIKVTLTEADLEKMELDAEKLKPDSPQLHLFLFRVMENIQKETGFNPYNGRVVVEALPNDSGDGLTLLVKKVKYRKVHAVKKNTAKKPLRRTYTIATINSIIYTFGGFEDACMAIENMSDMGLLKSSLYKQNGVYYIAQHRNDEFEKNHSILCEYSEEYEGGGIFETSLLEHGKIIAENESLVEMADGLRNLSMRQ